jgi:branched-subunit amino acid ABC-type transport system permease component
MLDILPPLAVNALITGSLYALAAVGMVITYQVLRVLNFAHGQLMMLGGYLFMAAHVDMGLPMLVAIPILIVSMVIVSLLFLFLFVRPFSQYNPLLVLVTTLALSTIIESVVSLTFGVNVRSLGTLMSPNSIELGSVYITQLQIFIICSAIAILGVTALVMHGTSFGRLIRAMAENPQAAESCGINTSHVEMIVCSVAAIMAAYAGVLISYETNLTPTMGTPYTIKALAAILLGGLGNVWGTVIGAYALGFIENFSIGIEFGSFSLPAGYKDAFAFVIILLVLLVRPEGLLGKRSRAT